MGFSVGERGGVWKTLLTIVYRGIRDNNDRFSEDRIDFTATIYGEVEGGLRLDYGLSVCKHYDITDVDGLYLGFR